jgi:EAL domain-containing protein (putative c-di-GMP-specific phosphodiesterase class I)
MFNFIEPTQNPELTDQPGELDFEFSFAFQPIVNARKREIVSFEALVRGPGGESSRDVFTHVTRENVFQFDQACRKKAICLASSLHLQQNLNLNLFPHSLYRTGMNIRAILQASLQYNISADKLIFELTESEMLTDHRRLIELVRMYHEFGFYTAIDDFGSGYSGLKLLVEYQPHYIKLDRSLIADINNDPVRQIVIGGMKMICSSLNIQMLAEGVETVEEFDWLQRAGVELFQGYYFAHPAFEALPDVNTSLYRV